ncbi:hypothetical protein [Candidatus Poriferisodalis sp.]|uniref:hypothetical protein n=1 Tax=Candidatus Poriferisodalis sp. TaxID=3101277 RepID=UPI003B017CA6
MAADDALRTGAALVLVAVAGALAAAVLWRLAGSVMQRKRWMRPNYRGEQIVATSGLLVVAVGAAAAVALTVLVSASCEGAGWFAYAAVSDTAAVSVSDAGRSASSTVPEFDTDPVELAVAGAVATVIALLGFGALGYRDDTCGDARVGGIAAHFRRSWHERRLTTGAQKALGGGAAALLCTQIALWGNPLELWDQCASRAGDGFGFLRSLLSVVTGAVDGWSPVALVRGALIVALGANLLNLLDRVPGRATKAALAWWLCGLVPAALADAPWQQGFYYAGADWAWLAWQSPALWATGAVGASVGLLRSEMREQHMQGDTGVNATGAALGLATVAMASGTVEWVMLAVLVALNLASERWSFSAAIDAVAPLRWLDRLGSPYRRP